MWRRVTVFNIQSCGGGFCQGASVQIPWDDIGQMLLVRVKSHGNFSVSHQSGGKMDGFLKWEYVEEKRTKQ